MTEANSDKDKTPRKLYRSQSNRVIGGVAAGFARHFDVDVIVVRILFILATVLGGFGVPAYIIAWVVIPKEDTDEQASENKTNQSTLIWGALFIILGFIILGRQYYWWDFDDLYYNWHWHPWSFWGFDFDFFIPTVLIIAGIVYIVKSRKHKNEGEEIPTQKPGEKTMEKKLTRVVDEKMIAGVCGGLAKYLNLDPAVVRIAFALLTIGSGFFTGVIVYAVMIFVVPEENTQAAVEVKPTDAKPTGTAPAKTTTEKKTTTAKKTASRAKAKPKTTTAKKEDKPEEDKS